jgi:hypothetical protein
MPIIKGRIVNDGAIISVSIGWGRASARNLRLAKRAVPVPIEAKALLDTGAEVTCLDPQLIEDLELPLNGYGLVNAPALQEMTFAAQYEASVTILHPSNVKNQDLVVNDLTVMELPLGLLGYQMVIGRDLLSRCQFLFNGVRKRYALKY